MSPFLVTLVALSAKATLVALVVLGVQRLLAGWMPAGFRHALWLLVALRLVIPSLPESPTSLFIAAHPETTLPALVEWLPEPPVPVFAHPPSTEPPAEVVASTSPIAMALVLLWLGGLLIVSSRLGKAHRDLRRLLKHATPIESGPTHQLFDRVRQQLSLRRRVRLLGSTELDGPAACGILRPTVLVPVDFASQRSQTEQTHALLHELAHLKRHDALWLHLAHLAMAIHWFNPFLWLARRQFHADLEAACDATVLGHLKRPERANYGRTVLAFGVRPSLAAQSLGFAVGSHRQLTQRIHMITTFRSPTRRRITLLFALSAALIAVTLTDLPAAFADNTAEAELFIHDVLKLYESKDEYEKTTAWAQAIADRVESARLPDAVMVEALRREADRQENADEASELPVQLRYLAGVIVQEAGGPPSASPQTLQTVQTLRTAGSMMVRQILEPSLGEDLPVEAISVPAAFRWRECPEVGHDELQKQLGSAHELPSTDAWGQPLDFCMRIDPVRPIGWIGVRSSGSDGHFEETYNQGAFEATRSESDIVWLSGSFLRWPQI